MISKPVHRPKSSKKSHCNLRRSVCFAFILQKNRLLLSFSRKKTLSSRYITKDIAFSSKQKTRIPEYIVDPDYVFLVGILGVDCNSGTGLDPDITSIFLNPAVILCHTLTFIHHYKKRIESQKGKEVEEKKEIK